MTCTKCQTNLKPGSKFCPECGTQTGGATSGDNRKIVTSDAFDQGNATGYTMGMNLTSGDEPFSIPHVELNPGDVVGSYTIKQKLGQGRFGTVYSAFDSLIEQIHAIKILPLISKDHIKNIILEFKSREEIKNFDFIIRAWQPQQAVTLGQDVLIYPMELADTTFRSWLQQHKNKPENILSEGIRLFRQICMGIKAIHDVGLSHLDINNLKKLLSRALD